MVPARLSAAPEGGVKAPAASLAPRAARVLLALLLLISAPAFAAEEDKDLDLIPPAAEAPPPAVLPVPASNAAQRNYLEDAFTFTPLRDSLVVPYPPPTPASWEDRLFFDSRDEWNLGNNVTLDYSGRFNLRAANDMPFPSHEIGPQRPSGIVGKLAARRRHMDRPRSRQRQKRRCGRLQSRPTSSAPARWLNR